MKRKILLPIFLALVLCFSVIPVSAAALDVAIFKLDDRTLSSVTADNGAVTLPDAPVTASGFVGWSATVNGQTVFLPAGATCSGIRGEVTFNAVTVAFSTNEESSVRLRDNDVALRFTSDVSKADYERLVALVGGASKVVFGTYIVPAKYVSYAGNIFTLEALEKKGIAQYIDVPAYAFYQETDTTLTVAGSVGKIRKGNYTMEYTGRGYMKVTYTNGETRTLYSDYRYKAHSITDVVLAAYNDRNESYTNLIVEPSGSTHSNYTETQLKMCRDFLDKIVMIMHDDQYRFYPYKAGYYTSPWKISQSEYDAFERCQIICAPPTGMTVEDAMGIYLDGKIYRLAWTRVENGRFVIDWDNYT